VTGSFSFQAPAKIAFGLDSLDALATEAPRLGHKALVIAGRHALGEGGPVERIRQLCSDGGVETVVFPSPPSGEPDLETVEDARRFCSESGCGFVIGLGGGSILDTAKAVAGLAREPASVRDYFDGRKIENATIPWVAIPTTAGSGAEVTKNSVLSDPARNIKRSIRDDRFFARLVLVDPRLFVSCPQRVTAESGMDALAQAIESFTSLGSNPMTDALAFEAARLILRSLPVAYRDGADLEARADMALGSLMAGVALANARLGAVHGLAHPIGVRWRVPHGRVCAVLLAPVMRFNQEVVGEKSDRLGRLVGEPIIEHIERLREQLGIARDFKDLGISAEEIEWIVRESLPSGSLKMNPRPAGPEELRRILEPLV